MALTKDFRETIRERALRQPAFRLALLQEGLEYEHIELQGAKIILTGQMGSQSFGTAIADSDHDFLSVVIPADGYFGMKSWGTNGTGSVRLAYEDADGKHIEHQFYDLKKFIDSCSRFNPNDIPLLWLERSRYPFITPEGAMLLDNRARFNSKLAFATFSGFARTQLQKMGGVFFDDEKHNRNLRFGLETLEVVFRGRLLSYRSRDLSETEKGDYAALRKVYAFVKESIKKIPIGAVTGRMGAKRKSIRDLYGYDTKFAAHTIRSMKMVIEFLNDPERGLIVNRRGIDADELIAIRNGKWPAGKVRAEADRLHKLAHEAAQSAKLPDTANMDGINDLTISILEHYHAARTIQTKIFDTD